MVAANGLVPYKPLLTGVFSQSTVSSTQPHGPGPFRPSKTRRPKPGGGGFEDVIAYFHDPNVGGLIGRREKERGDGEYGARLLKAASSPPLKSSSSWPRGTSRAGRAGFLLLAAGSWACNSGLDTTAT